MLLNSRPLMYTALAAIGCFTSWYSLSPIIREVKIIKKVKQLEKEGKVDEAEKLLQDTDFKEFKVTISPADSSKLEIVGEPKRWQ